MKNFELIPWIKQIFGGIKFIALFYSGKWLFKPVLIMIYPIFVLKMFTCMMTRDLQIKRFGILV